VGGWEGGFTPALDADRSDSASFAEFADPDGNTWVPATRLQPTLLRDRRREGRWCGREAVRERRRRTPPGDNRARLGIPTALVDTTQSARRSLERALTQEPAAAALTA
jgi:hypothetical protein